MLGFGVDGNVVSTRPGAVSTSNEHVGGRGVTIGYGFTPRWAAYGHVGWGGFLTSGGNRTGVGSADVGARYHLPMLARVVVPFVQAGVSSRSFSSDVYSTRAGQMVSVLSWQTLPAFGGGANVRLSPNVALSGMSTWGASTAGLASPRLHLGVLLSTGSHDR
jgi:hypothetical protein